MTYVLFGSIVTALAQQATEPGDELTHRTARIAATLLFIALVLWVMRKIRSPRNKN